MENHNVIGSIFHRINSLNDSSDDDGGNSDDVNDTNINTKLMT